MIEATVFNRLNTSSITDIVAERIYVNDAIENSQYPFIIYTVTNAEPQITLAGQSNLTKYTVQIDSFTHSVNSANSLISSIASQLHGYTGGNIQGSFLTDSDAEQIEDEEGDISHYVQQFEVWYTSTNITQSSDSTGLIQTTENAITLTACNNVLQIDCSGLTYNGLPLTGGGGGESSTYVFNQSTPAATWTINHNLENFPSVTIIDSGNNVVIGNVNYTSVNQCILTFAVAFGGKAYLNY